MRFNMAKFRVLHRRQGKPRYQHRLGDEGIKNSPAEKDLEILGNEKLDVSRQCALAAQKASYVLVCIKSSMAGRPRQGILSSALLW